MNPEIYRTNHVRRRSTGRDSGGSTRRYQPCTNGRDLLSSLQSPHSHSFRHINKEANASFLPAMRTLSRQKPTDRCIGLLSKKRGRISQTFLKPIIHQASSVRQTLSTYHILPQLLLPFFILVGLAGHHVDGSIRTQHHRNTKEACLFFSPTPTRRGRA